MVRVNLADAGEGFDPVPGGTYATTIDSGELRVTSSEGEAKHPGSEYVNWDFIVTQGDFEGRHIFTNTTVSHGDCDCGDEETFNKSLFGIAGLLKATERYSEDQLASDDFELEVDDVIGSDLALLVGISKSEEYGDQNTVKRYRPISAMVSAVTDSLLP